MTPTQKAKFLADKHNTLAIMSEIIRLRHAVEGIKSSDEEIYKEAGESMKKTGSYISKIKTIMKR